ncbi:hypothetical protein N9Q47_01595 [Vicingaceae bacterium]|nr:hypothetical protein [Vicingaceae bacterium]
MMKRIGAFIIFLLSFLSYSHAQEFTVKLSSPEIRIGEQVTLELECRFSAAEKQIMLPALKDTITKFIEVVDIYKADTTFDDDDITSKFFSQKIIITSWDSGLHVIPPLMAVIGNDTLYSDPILLSVTTVELAQEQDIKDIKGILEVPFFLWDWILAHQLEIGLIIGLLLLVIVGYLIYRKYATKSEAVEELPMVPKEEADVIATRKLKELEDKKVWQSGDVKEFHSQLSFITREYVENRFEINALEQTTDKIAMLLVLHPDIEKADLQQFIQMLQLADMAKFAKQKPIDVENEQAIKTGYSFIEQTKVIAIENDQNETLNLPEKDA